MTISTHVLDAALGRPAQGVDVELEHRDASGWHRAAVAATDANGRIADIMVTGDEWHSGAYRLTFATAAYFARTGQHGFYPEVSVTFEITDVAEHYHVPLLLSPFAYSTYRGS